MATIPATAVKYDKISIEAAQHIRYAGGNSKPVDGQPGRYWFIPPKRCKWTKTRKGTTLLLPSGWRIKCIAHETTVELILLAD